LKEDLPIKNVLNKAIFHEYKWKTTYFGYKLTDHIVDRVVEGNEYGWMNLDELSMVS